MKNGPNFALFVTCVCVFFQHCSAICGHRDLERNASCYCVVADDSKCVNPVLCSKCSCHNLTYFAHSEPFCNSDSTFYFLPGNHVLDRGVKVLGHFANISLIGLTSDGNSSSTRELCTVSSSPEAVVQCEGKSGFYFRNVSNLTIAGLGFNNCGLPVNLSSSYKLSGAVLLDSVSELTMCGVEICSSRGWGLLGAQVYGRSLINNTAFDSGRNTEYHGGGNMLLSYEVSVSIDTSFTVSHSSITNGLNRPTNGNRAYGGGLHIFLKTTDKVNVLLDHLYFSGNVGKHGGNVAVFYKTRCSEWTSSVTFVNCHFLNGSAEIGGGLHITLIADIECDKAPSNQTVVNVTGCVISNNSAEVVGAGAYIQLHEHPRMASVAMVVFDQCVFDNNTNQVSNHSRGGTAVNLINFRVPDYISHRSPQYSISFAYCNFTRNRGTAPLDDSVGTGTLYVEENALTTVKDCYFEHNNCSGITAVHSTLVLEGHIVLRNNSAYNGGGMVMCANSILFFNQSREVEVIVEDCHADNFGGGIYAEFECSQAIPPCFFQVKSSSHIPNKLIHLRNNIATYAGHALYGGAVDSCYMFGPPYINNNKSKIFNSIFNITPANQDSVSSNPIKVCFCSNGHPDCIHSSRRYGAGPVYPGATLTVTVVVVGQRDGPVPGLVFANSGNEAIEFSSQMSVPMIGGVCTAMHYTVLSDSDAVSHVSLNFNIGNPDFRNAIIDTGTNATLEVTMTNCPYGFSVNNKFRKCDCNNWVNDDLKDASCNITTNSIHRQSNSTWWIGVAPNGKAMHAQFCPFDYCITEDIDIQINESDFEDRQCAHNRSGALCGECRGNLSNVLGSNSCKVCQDRLHILRVVGLVLLFALLGIIFVFLVGILDITVSEGTLNAIVFYMNVVRVNTDIFFDSPMGGNALSSALKVFVAWMNLDLGIETCFYNGMGTVGRMGLQFIFPLYLFILSGLIIYFSRKSSTVTKLFGKNVVQILATVIFHLYAKILRILIDIFRVSNIEESPNMNNGHLKIYYVWAVDGTIPYLQNHKHTVFFILAVVLAAVTLPYTLTLLFIQCLRKTKFMFWVNKLKPLFDAYTGPYKDTYHFWTGFLLMMRIFLFVAIVLNTTKGEILNLSLISTTIAILFVLIRPGIYKSPALNFMEVFAYANLIVLVAGTAYTAWHNYSKDATVILCIGSMFLLFCGVIVYHILKKMSVTRRWGLMKVWLLDRRWPWMKRKPIRSLILPYVDPDNDEYLSSSEGELDPILHNAPPVARYDEYREPLIETSYQK